jgi:TP901 family phage tail tape measure protein
VAEVVKGIVDIEINTGNAAAELKILQQQINSVFLSLNKNNTASLAASQKYSASLADMVNSSKVFTAETVRMRTAAGALDDTLKKGQATLGQYFSAKYVKNGALFAETLDLARQKASVLQTQFIATGKSSKGMQDALAIRPLQAFADQATIASQRTQILSSMFRQGTTQLVNFGKNVQWAGRQLMVGFTVPLTIFGTTAGKVFADLEKQTVAFKKVYGDLFTTPKELQSNLKAVQDLGREYTKYGIAVKDTMSLAAQAAAAGRRNSDLTDAVSQATRLATLGQMDQNAALETTIALQSAFKLSGDELANTINYLNMVENQTVVSLQDIAAAIPRVAPVIEGLGGSVKDLTVFLAAMQEGGVSAEQGANALKSGLGSLINPSKSATEALGKFGVNLDAIIQTNQGDLMKIVTGFAQALSTLGEFEQQQALEDVFGKYQYARLGALFENLIRDGSQARQVMDTMGYSVEELAMTADRELKTIEEAFSVQLKAAVEKFKLAIAPIGEIFVKLAIPLVNFATSIADAFNSLPDFSKKFIAFAAIITGLVIPAGTMFFGLLMNLTGTLAKLFQFMGAFGKGFLQGGIVGAFKNATQSTKYFSTAEIEAALAAQQLGTATEFTNSALRKQVTEAMGAAGAVKYLGDSYTILIAKMMEAAKLAPYTMGVGQSAAGLAKSGMSATGRVIRPPQMRNSGGRIFMSDGSTVPGTGNSDTVPAMLTPGEFIVNKQATEKNLGLLYAINGGGAGYNKGGVTYASRGAYLGPREALAASTAELGAFTSNRRASASKAVLSGASSKEGVQSLLNNLVYLINPNSNKQLIGNRIMGGFDKRGVPLDQLKKEMTSDVGMWMIDAYAGQKWAKTAYKTTLSNNFDSIASKYPGKEIRFLDSKGLERIQDVVDRPEYANVKFVSVKELHNEALYNRLRPDHLQRLLSDDTANVMKQRMRSSTGQMGLRSGYEDLNSNSYTKMQQSWRGTKRPAGFEGAHMYGMGGKIDIQNLNKGGLKYLVKSRQVRSAPNSQMINSIKSDPRIKNLINKFLDKEFDQIFEGMLLNDAIVLRQKGFSSEGVVKHLRRYDPSNPGQYREALSQYLIKKGKLKGSLSKRVNAASPAFREETLNMLINSGLISKTSKNLVNYDRGHHEPFTKHRSQSTVREGYMGQAAFDETNQLYRILKTKGIDLGETASTARELELQHIQLRKRLNLKDFEYLNKGGMIPGFGMGGLRGKAIFERGKAGVPKIMNLSGLAKNGENVVIDLVRGGMNVDDAIKFAKLTQTGQLRTGIPTGPVRDIEDYIKRKIDFEKSQGSMTNELYRKYYGLRNRPIAEQQKTIDNYNKLYWGDSGPGMYKKGGVAKYNRGNIVPGSGNTDTVPAMLTPGEFVVNKESTRNNMALLKAINNGSLSGYNKGGKIPGVQYFATEEQNRLVMDLATNNRGVAGPTSSLGKTTMQSRASSYMARNPAMSMGLMSAGFVLPMIGQQMQQATNKYVNGVGSFINTLTPAILAMSIFPSLIPKLFGPWGILIAAVTATAIGLKKYRESVDKAARESAKQGASAGGAANALDVMSKLLGKQTPLQTSLSSSIKFTDKQLQAQEESFAALQSDFGKDFIAKTKVLSSDEQTTKVVSLVQNAIAAGMIDKTMGAEFARVVGAELGNSLLAPQVIREMSKQSAGSQSLLRLAEQRVGYRSGTPQATMSPIAQRVLSQQRDRRGYLRESNNVDSIYTGPRFNSEDASFNIGLAIQSFKAAAEAQALATQELQRGAISQSEYNATISKSAELQQKAQQQMSNSVRGSLDIGATKQGLKDQLILGGFTEDQVTKIEEVSGKLGDVGKEVQIMLQVTSGQIRAEDIPPLIEFIQNKDNAVSVEWSNKFVGNEIEASKFAMWAQNNLSSSTAASFRAALNMDFIGLEKAGQLQQLLYALGIDENGNLSAGGNKLILDIQAGNTDAIKEFSNIYENLGSGKAGKMKQAAIDFAVKIGGSESSFDYVLSKIKDFNALTLENKFASITYAVQIADIQGKIAQAGKNISLQGAVDAYGQIDKLNKSILAMNPEAAPKVGDTGPESQISLFKKSFEEQKKYIAAINKLKKDGSKIDFESLSTMSETLAIEISQIKKQKDRVSLLNSYQTMRENARKIEFAALTSEEKQLQVLDIQEKLYSRQLTLIDRRINLKQKDINAEQDLNEIRQNGLDQISKQEDSINEAYNVRLEALDKIDRAGQRNADREKSRIDLARSLTAGDIGGAAKAAADIQRQESGYKLEDARTALETQRQKQIDSITTTINGKLMTRKQIEDSIVVSNENIYKISQAIKGIETEKLDIYKLQEQSADRRFQYEIQALAQLTQNQAVYDILIAKEKELGFQIVQNRKISNDISYIPSSSPAATSSTGSGDKPKEIKTTVLKPTAASYAATVKKQIAAGQVDAARYTALAAMYAAKKKAFGGMMYRGSNEAPPAIKMAYGSMVPGMGNTDRVPALLTPGEFVIRKSVASAYMPLLEQLNGNIYPGAAMPKGSAKNNSNLYNNSYSINVNVAGTDASPDEIANAVMSKIKQVESRSLRGVKVV